MCRCMAEFRTEPDAVIIGKTSEEVQKEQMELLGQTKALIARVLIILKGASIRLQLIRRISS